MSYKGMANMGFYFVVNSFLAKVRFHSSTAQLYYQYISAIGAT